MALVKNVDTKVGVAASYHRIIRCSFDVIARDVRFTLAGYASQQARQDGKEPLMESSFAMGLAEGQAPEDVGRVQMYAFAKVVNASDQAPGEAPRFQGAEDALS